MSVWHTLYCRGVLHKGDEWIIISGCGGLFMFIWQNGCSLKCKLKQSKSAFQIPNRTKQNSMHRQKGILELYDFMLTKACTVGRTISMCGCVLFALPAIYFCIQVEFLDVSPNNDNEPQSRSRSSRLVRVIPAFSVIFQWMVLNEQLMHWVYNNCFRQNKKILLCFRMSEISLHKSNLCNKLRRRVLLSELMISRGKTLHFPNEFQV